MLDKGCSGSDPFEQLYQFYPILNFGLTAAEKIVKTVGSSSLGISGLSLVCCGTTKCLQPTFYSLNLLVENLNSLLDLVEQTRELLDCQTSISPILHETFNSGVCTLSMTAAAWMVILLLIIIFSGVVIISLRSALFQLQIIEDTDVSGSDTIITNSCSSVSMGEAREIEIILSKSKKFYTDDTKTWLDSIVTSFSSNPSVNRVTPSCREDFPEEYDETEKVEPS
jgi:hypothetical protein